MNKNRILRFSLLAAVALLSACAPDVDNPYTIATNAALGTPAPPQYQTAAAAVLGTTPAPAADERTVDMAATMIYDNMAAGMTRQALEAELARQKAAATATAVSIKATAQRREELSAQATQAAREAATARAGEQFATATQQQAWIAATATERSWQITATVDAQFLAIRLENMATQQAADAIRLEGESRQIELAVERQQIKNKADAILPWALVIAALIVAAGLAYTASRIKDFQRNPDGTFNPVGVKTNRGMIFLRPDLLPIPAISVAKDGSVLLPPPLDADLQAETTRRAQAVDALRALPPGRERQALQIAAESFGEANANAIPAVELLSPHNTAAIGPVLDELEGQALDHE